MTKNEKQKMHSIRRNVNKRGGGYANSDQMRQNGNSITLIYKTKKCGKKRGSLKPNDTDMPNNSKK